MGKRNYQLVILETSKGTARDEEQLLKVWKLRLDKWAKHYNVVKVIIGESVK